MDQCAKANSKVIFGQAKDHCGAYPEPTPIYPMRAMSMTGLA